jgi:hypothetical protein
MNVRVPTSPDRTSGLKVSNSGLLRTFRVVTHHALTTETYSAPPSNDNESLQSGSQPDP